MARHTYTFEDGEQIFFAPGSFDDFCVYRVPRGGWRKAPRDADYFAELQRLGDRNGRELIYGYFRSIYARTDETVNQEVVELILRQASTLEEEDRLAYVKVMMTIYYAMIAEENRKPDPKNPRKKFPLKKKVKKIGVYQALVIGMAPYEAANYSRGRSVRELEDLLAEYEEEEDELALQPLEG